MSYHTRVATLLHHERIITSGRDPGRWLLFLHGIYGAGRNWRSFARRLTTARPDWGGILVDLRLHGESPPRPPPHTVNACAEDLAELTRSLGLSRTAVLGHSFGGKVALRYAVRDPGPLEQIWIVDSTPSARDPDGMAVRMLAALRASPGPFSSRKEAATALQERGFSRPVARWMTTNLEGGDEAYRWRLDPDALAELLDDFFRLDLWDVVESGAGGRPVHFVKADDSDVLPEEECERIRALGERGDGVRLHRVAGGHWVNVDNPDALLNLLEERLPT